MPVRAQDQITILDLTDGYSVELSLNSISFGAEESSLGEERTVVIYVTALNGNSNIIPFVRMSDIDVPAGSGITCSIGSVINYRLPVIFVFPSSLSSDGIIDIPVTLNGGTPDEIVIAKSVSYSLSNKGEAGEPGVSPTVSKVGDTVTIVDAAGHTVTVKDGPVGATGENGLIFHVAWANSSDGTVDFSTTIATNKLYMGTYEDRTLEDSTQPSSYSWVKIKGENGAKGDDGYTFIIDSSGGTQFDSGSTTTTLTARLYKGGSEIDIPSNGVIPNEGSIKWYTYANGTETPVPSSQGGPTAKSLSNVSLGTSQKIIYLAKLESGSSVKTQTYITLSKGIYVISNIRYYQLKNEDDPAPTAPADNVPITTPWSDSEPSIDSLGVSILLKVEYTVDQITFSDGSIKYSPVSISAQFEAAKTSYKVGKTKYGYCSTAPGTTAKIVTCEDFILFDGAVINVLFSQGIFTSGGSSSFSLNVNNQGAKTVMFNGDYVSATNPFRVAANTTVLFVYGHLQSGDAGYWLAVPTDSILRGTCTIAANTENKTASIANAILHIGSVAVIKFTYGNTSTSPKLALSDLGYFPIDKKTPPMWVANKTMSFTLEYESGNGLYWRVNADSFKDNFYHDDTGAHVKSELGNQELLLASDSIQFKESSNVLAKYTATLIELGKNAITSVIKMCKNIFTIKVERTEFESNYVNKGIIEINLDDLDLDEQFVNTSSLIIRNVGKDPETDVTKSASIDLRFQPYGSKKTSINMEAESVFISGTQDIQVNGPVYHGPTQILDSYGYIFDGDGNKISTSYARKNVSISNLNVTLQAGHYIYSQGATGAPMTTAGGCLFVFRTSATYQHQLAFPNNSSGTDHVFHRMRYVNSDAASSYTAWKLISMNGHSHETLNGVTTLLELSYTPSAANVWDRVGTATTSKFTLDDRALVYIYCSSRRSGLGVNSAGSSATVTRTDTYNCVDPDGNLRRSPVFFLAAGSYYAYAKSPGTAASTIRVYKLNGYT